MRYLYDETGRVYLDAYNNVPLVGHSHPRVVRAVAEQIALLNTDARSLHDDLVRYAARLTACDAGAAPLYILNSASEADQPPCGWRARTPAARTSSSSSRPITATRPDSSI